MSYLCKHLFARLDETPNNCTQIADLQRRLAHKERSIASTCEQVEKLKLQIKNVQDKEKKLKHSEEVDELKLLVKNLQDKEKKLKYEWTVRFTKLSDDSRRQLDKAKADANERLAQVKALHQEKLAACNKKLKAALSKQRATVATSPHRPVVSMNAMEEIKARLTATQETLNACQIKLRGTMKQVPALRTKVEEQEQIIKSLRIREGELRLDLDHWKLSHNTVQRELQKKEHTAVSDRQLAQSKNDAGKQRELRLKEELRICQEQIQKLTDDLSTANMCLKMRRKESDAKEKTTGLDEQSLKLQLEQIQKERALLQQRSAEVEQMREQMLQEQEFLQTVEKTMYNRLRQQLELVEMHETLEQDAATLGEQEWQQIHERVSTLQDGIAQKDQQMRQMENALEKSMRIAESEASKPSASVLRVREVVRASRETNDKVSKPDRNKRQFNTPRTKSGSSRKGPNKLTVPVTKSNRQRRNAGGNRYRVYMGKQDK